MAITNHPFCLDSSRCLPTYLPAILWEIDEQFLSQYNNAVQLPHQIRDILYPFKPDEAISSPRKVSPFRDENLSNIPPSLEVIPQFFLCDVVGETREI